MENKSGYQGVIALTEERLQSMEKMLGELIRIVGNTNAAVEELRQDMAEVKEDVRVLKAEVKELKEDVKALKVEVKELKEDVRVLKEEVKELRVDLSLVKEELAEFRKEANGKFLRLEDQVDYVKFKILENEEKIYLLRRQAR